MMNKLRFKLVFSKRLGMLVPIAEIARTHQKTVTTAGAADRDVSDEVMLRPLCRLSLRSVILLVAGCLSWISAPVLADDANALPVQQPGYNLPAGVSIPTPVNNTMNINTTIQNAVIRWDSFNIGSQAAVNFNMPNASSSVLNRVMGSGASFINGALTSNGHVYIANQNGIYFGAGSQVNVGSLTATTLDNLANNNIENIYKNGILSNKTEPVFSFADAVGVIDVAKGASITAANGGRVMLLAPDVTNSGVIKTPDGQTILAAGKTVYLSTLDKFAGLLVEVSSGGNATNLGDIIVNHGNASLIGLAVNQQGNISASTSVRANGSIYLKAKEIQSLTTPGNDVYGKVTLGTGSKTAVTIDTKDTEEVFDAQVITPSIVDIKGKNISIDGSVIANSGQVNVTATDNQGNNSSLFLGDHALIDVSGVDATAPMSRNQLSIQLFSDQLRDSPVLRGGELFGEILFLDARKGTKLLSQSVIDQAKAGITRTVAERSTNGGQVNFSAVNMISKAGSTIDLSAGSTTYTEGTIRESSLLINGKWVLASEALPNTPYQGVSDYYSVSSERWGQTRRWALTANALNGLAGASTENAAKSASVSGYVQPGYQQGGDAGALNVSTTNMALQGDVIASTVSGLFQRGESSEHANPLGGAFKLTYNNSGALNIVSSTNKLSDDFNENSQLTAAQEQTSELSASMLANGVNRVEIAATGQVNLNTDLSFQPAGSLNVQGSGGVNVNANIRLPSGAVTLSASQNADVNVANNVSINVAGLYTNDLPGVSGALVGKVGLNGGRITVNNGLRLGQGVTMDASSGAWINNKGQLSAGHGGDITVTMADNQLAGGVFNSFGMMVDGQQTLGGHLTVKLQGEQATGMVDHIQLGGLNPEQENTLWLSEGFFKQGGFSNYTISNADRLNGDVMIGDLANRVVTIAPEQHSRLLGSAARVAQSGSDLNALTSQRSLANSMRKPSSLEVLAGDDLTLQSNARIMTDMPVSRSGSTGDVSLNSKGQMTILGDIIAPGGDIKLSISAIPDTGDFTLPNASFDPTLSLFLGETATLSARAQYITPPSSDGNLRKAFVTSAGNITLSAGNGVLITKAGSLIDVSGASGSVDLPVSGGYVRETVAGNAGVISVSGRDGIALDGTLMGTPSGSGEGGTLNITLGGKNASGIENDILSPLYFASGTRILTVTNSKELMAANNTAGGSNANLINTSNSSTEPLTTARGVGQVSAEQIAQGGFDNVALKVDNVSATSGDAIHFANTSMNVPSLLTLDATTLSGSANLNASTLVLANNSSITMDNSQLTAGTAIFEAKANFIDLQGDIAINNVAETSLQSRTDIRGRSITSALKGSASLSAPGLIKLDAAQIYPATGVDFTVTATGAHSRIEVTNQSQSVSAVPLSAVGSLTLNADSILQAGVLRAPLGQITLNASQNLTLTSGSLTSVSAEGSLIPYAVTVLGGTELADTNGAINNFMTAVDKKKVTLNANDMNLQAGARVDISGNGDTMAYEWIQGIGGSVDVLSQAGYYAVLPSLGNQYAPYDFLMSAGSDVGIGQAIYLSGGNGLAAGKYTLLPAHYALLPGAFLISANGADVQLNTQLTQADGTGLSSGYLTKIDGTSRGQYTSFNIINGNSFYKDYGTKNYKGLAEYLVSSGNALLTKNAIRDGKEVPRLTNDAGQLVLAAGNSLNLEADINTSNVAGAKGALVDISSNDIRVVSTVDPQQAGLLQISADQLSKINADSILLGGSRAVSGKTQTITTTASNVTFSNDADHAVQTGELIVASQDTITVNKGAVVKTSAKQDKTGTTTLVTSGDGALLAVSANNDFELSRTNVSAAPITGKLTVEEGATISAARSMVLDATNAFDQFGDVKVADGGTVTLGANQYAIGDQPVNGATRISSATLADFGRLSAMTFNSYKNIDILGAVNFGNSNLNITFNTAGIAHHDAGNVSINANHFVLKNTNNGSFTAPSTLDGQLAINANQITFGDTGSVSSNIGGFNTVSLNANKDIRFTGTGTVNINADQATMSSAVMTADSGANFSLATTGNLQTLSNGQQPASTSGLGATLNLSANEMQLGGKLILNAGAVNAVARSGNLTLASGGGIDVSAAKVAFDNTHSATTDAGNVHLTSTQGNVQIENTALLNLKGGATDGDAGTLQVEAKNGRFVVADNTLQGQAAKDQKSASLKLDVASLDNFSEVNKALESGGFNNGRDIRVRSGDVTIAAGDTVTAHAFTLAVDSGNATVAGRINADGNKGGDVAIYANGLVTLANTAQITARGQDANQSSGDRQTGSGGSVLLSSNSLSTENAVSAEAGALIDTSGYDAAANGNKGVDGYDGSVTLRGARGTTGTANTVNVALNTTAAIKGASEVTVEGSRSYTATAFTAANMAGMIADTNSFYDANTGAGAYAATQDGLAAKVLPYVEVRSATGETATNMTVGTADVNLRSFGALLAGRGGSLTLRSNGNLTFSGTLSDGFDRATTAGVLQPNADTFNFNLVAGADYSAANIMETNAGIGDFSLANNKLIRTGEGNIAIAAGGNMTLGNVGSVIYTVGKSAELLSGFTAASSGTNVPTAASYVNNGGDIAIQVAGNISGVATTQSVNQWLLRQGGNGIDTSWWVRPDLFQQGVGALGGGNVNIQAGGNITNVSASSATNAQFVKTIDAQGNEVRTSLVNGGGDVSVSAGRNLVNGVYYAGRGSLDLQAGESIPGPANAGANGVVIALQDASATVKAKNNVKVQTVFNPTLWVQGSTLAQNQIANSTFFNSYSEDSALNVASLSGNIEVGQSNRQSIVGTGLNSGGYTTLTNNDMAAIHPGTVNATAFAGDITTYKMVLAPASKGNLSLLAAGSVQSGVNTSGNINPTANILISDADLSTVLNIFNPTTGSPTDSNITSILGSIKTGVSAVPVHQNDATTAVIVARDGDVRLTGLPTDRDTTNIYGIKSSKPVYINAGNNLTLHASIQHNNIDDVSEIHAGNDFIMENGKQLARIDINGPGELVIKAGRNIDLGNTSGILSLANTVNPNLADKSANITLMAGLGSSGANVDGLIRTYIDPTGSGPASLQGDTEALASYREGIAIRVQAYMNEVSGSKNPTTGEPYTAQEAMTAFLTLDTTRKEIFALRQFQVELLEAGREYINTASTARSDDVIASLFSANDYSGDLLMYQSQIRTSRDGDINLFAPGGLINAGVASNSSLQHDIGVVTEKGGNIGAYADGNFLVNQSKVITQYGSDILIWSNRGDIDAGRGSKAAISVPERVVSVNANGDVTVEVKGVASGSGIRAQTYDPDGPTGPQQGPKLEDATVALFAPRGVLDAGEAGVAAGNLLVGAIQVLNSSNITVSGSSSGVPVADTGSLAGAALSSSSTSAGAANTMTENLGNQMSNQNVTPKELPPIVTVKTIRLED
ncbi:filamentous haemagglutinin family protein [Methylophilus medardicus]|uniref:Filamentous hemagglutinin N-terminal domain-containing protein n=1 Tax=Methylophilus medardicus TaxID=2588534 RepID=A0A5B8CUV2_9PROT|nr:filamentous haemagglutinin family protein [Methylophilus medardicus]QDC44685.1 filamentous hemagglutinin N-terminal domain-containing protein [Methylophilus medardicus]QDC49692.1 filamentous hemagglutinin N-terminal domain-containing protein [Methylophilus medardicus]QDC53397.1 filamentous hemagglutinin N-terminal domain-containing protein [Methylophilus medardicus]